MNILLLAHDLSDAGVLRRVAMLRYGGATVSVAGFRRTAQPVLSIDGCAAVDFGQTGNGAFLRRIMAVARVLLRMRRYRALFAGADIIVARNLEMLAIAVAGRRPNNSSVLIYEILDVHRLLLGRGFAGRFLRALERRLLRHAQAVFTSSPAFLQQYFHKINPTGLPTCLIENKLLQPLLPPDAAPPRPAGPPWVIGWFGIIRCRKSLQILATLARHSEGRVEVVIRGRPALDQIPDFHDIVADTPGLRFEGAYKYPDDLASLYRSVHFSWTIDMYEEGLNSSWLLPNRLYEGGYFGAVPIAAADVETGRVLKNLGIGVELNDLLSASLKEFLDGLTPEIYAQLAHKARAVPLSQWVYDGKDCAKIVQFLTALKPALSAGL